MRTLKFLLRKEFRQIFRNKALLPLLFVVPIMQLLILPLAADYEVKNINIAIVDHDRSTYSQKLIAKIGASGYFKLTDYTDSFNKAFEQLETDRSDLILEIPQGFERNVVKEDEQQLFLAVNAINGVKANLGGAYLGQIIADYNTDVRGMEPDAEVQSFPDHRGHLLQLVQSVNELPLLYGSGYFGIVGYDDRILYVRPQYRQGKRSGHH